MSEILSSSVLKCPYCGEMLSSHRGLRVHVGTRHRDKIDAFAQDFFGGRWVEVDFVTLMLQRATSDLTEEFCAKCGGCLAVCPISKPVKGFTPKDIVAKLRSSGSKELLRSDTIWICTSCLACKDGCPDGTSPFDVITTLRNLSARIGYQYPKGYEESDKRLYRTGFVQEPQIVQTRTGERLSRESLGLLPLKPPRDMTRFREALKKLSGMRVSL